VIEIVDAEAKINTFLAVLGILPLTRFYEFDGHEGMFTTLLHEGPGAAASRRGSSPTA
jgi:hypothetical protein